MMKITNKVPPTGLLALITAITLLAFAANSLLARMALTGTVIDPISFTTIRLVAAAITLALIITIKGIRPSVSRSGLRSAVLLFVYASAFSLAYRGIDTGVGALILFSASQLLMISIGFARGEKASLLGVTLALGGLIVFLAPSGSTPSLEYASLMLVAGLAWGGFSLMGGSSAVDPIIATANSFIFSVPLALILMLIQWNKLQLDATGIIYAALSGCVTSALGYITWYWVRARIAVITAGTVQLSVPILSAVLGFFMLNETLSVKNVLAALVVLLGVAITIWSSRR